MAEKMSDETKAMFEEAIYASIKLERLLDRAANAIGRDFGGQEIAIARTQVRLGRLVLQDGAARGGVSTAFTLVPGDDQVAP